MEGRLVSVDGRLKDFATRTDKSYRHQYIEVYEGLLEPIRHKVSNVLEVGIQEGYSHLMWRDYFSDATVYGIDISDLCEGMAGEDRIDVRFMNAYSTEAIDGFGSLRFDLLVDDGPHTLASQEFFVGNYCHLMSNCSVLVVEDIPDPDWIPVLANAVPDSLKMNAFCIDRRWVPGRNSINDELMFIIDRRFV